MLGFGAPYIRDLTVCTPCVLQFSRQFYIAQWYRDCSVEAEKLNRKLEKHKDEDEEDEKIAAELEKEKDIMQVTEKRKDFLVLQMLTSFGAFAKYK